MNRLSNRRLRFSAIAKQDLYTKEEYIILSDMLLKGIIADDKAPYVDVHDNLRTYLDKGYVIDSLDSQYTDSPKAYGDTRYYHISFLESLMIGDSVDKRFFLFLIHVPLERVPVYINDFYLAPAAQWRLSIAK